MVLKMTLYKGESSSFMAERKREMGNEVHNALCNNTDRSHSCPVDTSFVHEISLERDLHVESAVSISSESGLTEALSNSNLNCLKKKNKRRKKKIKNAPKTDNIDVDLQGVTSETMTAPFRTEASVDVSTKKISETSPFEIDVEIDVIIDTSTKMELVATPPKVGSFLSNFNNNNNNDDASHDCPEGASLMQDTLLGRDSYVESMVKIGSQSGFLEAQSNSNLDCLRIEKKKKKPKKKKKLNAPKTDDIDASLQEVTSETITAPLLTEASVDVTRKKVPETASSEVEVMCDTRPVMDLVATPVKVGSFLNNNNNDTSHDCPKGASLMQDIPLGRDSYVESMVKIGSESGLIEEQSNSNLDCLHNKKRKKRPKKKKRLNAPKTGYMDVNLPEVTTETITGPLGTEASVDVSRKEVPETASSEVEVICDTRPVMDLVATPVKVGSFLNNNNNDTSHDYPKGASLMQDIPLGRDSYVESMVKIGSGSGLIEEQSNSNLDCLHNKKRKKRPKKKKRLNAPKTGYIDVNLQEVTTETNTGPLGTEASVDVSRKKVPETASSEVEVMCDARPVMDLVATPVKVGSFLNNNNNDTSHDCPKGASLMQDIPLGRDSYVESMVKIGSESGLIEEQSNSNLDCLHNKKRKKRLKKKKRLNAPKTGYMDVNLQEVTTETITGPLGTEASVDVSRKKVPETASSEVEVMCDTRPVMDLVATPVKVGSFLNNNNNDTSHDCPKGASLMQDIPLGRDSYVESRVKIGSESVLIEEQSNSNLDCLHNKKRKKRQKKKKRLNAPKTGYMDVNLPEVTTEAITGPLGTEASVDVSRKKVPETASSEVEVMCDTRPVMDLVATPVKVGSFLNNNNNDTSHDCPKGASLIQDIPLGRDSYVESMVKIGSESGLIEEQSNSNLDCLHNKKRKRRPKKKKRLNAPNTDYMDVNLQEVTTETVTGTLGTEASVDVSRKKVPETATGEVGGMCDTSTKKELVGSPVKIGPMNMSRGQRKRMRKKKLRENRNDSVTTDMFAEKDSSLQLPVNLGLSNISMEEQPTNVPASLQMTNVPHFGKEDVRISPKELDLASMKGDFHLSRNHICFQESTNLMEKQYLPSENYVDSHEKCDAKSSRRKRKRKFSKSLVNSSDCIKDDRRDISLDHSEDAHTVDHIGNKLARVIKVENAVPAQFLGDIEMKKASVNSLEGQPACKESEKKIKVKNLQKDATKNGLMKNVSMLLEGHLEDKNIKKAGEVKITVQKSSGENGGSVESSSGSKVKTSDNISDHHIFCKHIKQKNVNLEIKTKEVSSSSHLVIKDDCSVNETNKEENQHSSHSVPIRACIGHLKKKLLVLDVNGILVDITQQPVRKGWKPHFVASKKAVFKRPYCHDFLQFCFERFNVGIWTSRIKKNVETVVQFLLGGFKHRLLFCWDASHCRKTGLFTIENNRKPLVLKELKKLWVKAERDLPWRKGEYNETNTLLVDDSPYKALHNPAYTAIFPYSYQYWDTEDKSLGPGGDLREYLERLSHAENVQEFVRQNPFGQPPINESNPHWRYYSKVFRTRSSRSRYISNTSSVNTNEGHQIPQQTLPRIVSVRSHIYISRKKRKLEQRRTRGSQRLEDRSDIQLQRPSELVGGKGKPEVNFVQ